MTTIAFLNLVVFETLELFVHGTWGRSDSDYIEEERAEGSMTLLSCISQHPE
jgi:hypothetical protein